ncbi:hypothetical protein EW146_g2948 [Bondarzewia mesenterica]|uniref:Zn(2)-C6 fungal-type domain-containing protein n=1 Tax=Bondarzewia mesenterica TaxID=1095465 RepID=A0A4S4M501_9AGAM|nr:hypothetical protein EW146_g2948 [Bondarzewia mesenterica]
MISSLAANEHRPRRNGTGDTRSRRAAIACTECRRRQVKCASSQNPHKCRRCEKMNLDCIYVRNAAMGRSLSPQHMEPFIADPGFSYMQQGPQDPFTGMGQFESGGVHHLATSTFPTTTVDNAYASYPSNHATGNSRPEIPNNTSQGGWYGQQASSWAPYSAQANVRFPSQAGQWAHETPFPSSAATAPFPPSWPADLSSPTAYSGVTDGVHSLTTVGVPQQYDAQLWQTAVRAEGPVDNVQQHPSMAYMYPECDMVGMVPAGQPEYDTEAVAHGYYRS